MKAIITGFLDSNKDLSFDEQLDLAIKNQMSSICLRMYKKRPLIELKDSELKEIVEILKNKKMKIAFIDTNIKSYDINNDSRHKEALNDFKVTVLIAKKLKVQHLIYKLPIFTDVMKEYKNIELRLTPFVEFAMKHNKKIIICPNNSYKANVYAYIMKKMKSNVLSVLFDPVEIMNNDESTTTTYRILKRKIGAFRATDANSKNIPKLMGYGDTNVITILKKLVRDKYSGFLLVDNKFQEELKELETKDKGLMKKLFNRKKKKKKTLIEEVSKVVFPNEEIKNATWDDILANQIKMLKTLFK